MKGSSAKVGFYLRNQNVSEVDLSRPEEGNPGVGGTQFNFVTLPYYLEKHNADEVTSVIYANAPAHLPEAVKHKAASSTVDAAKHAKEDGCDLLVFRPTDRIRSHGLIDALEDLGLEGIAWGHNVPLPLADMDALASSPAVRRFVVVGRERLDQIRDHSLFEKSRCIYNGFDPSPYVPNQLTNEGPPTVTYLGCLIPPKGFHRLAEVWPSIKQRVPNAELVVIGSGQLYDRDAELGEWGIASEDYEKRFRPYLSNDEGQPHPSVNFKGTLGTEKIPLLQCADVGVVNPTGRTENCPGSAIEFQAAGTPVVSVAEWGLLDAVRDGKTGVLLKDPGKLGKTITELLLNHKRRKVLAQEGIEFIRERFSPEKICNEWTVLFERVKEGAPPMEEPIRQNLLYRDKWLRELMRLGKKKIPSIRTVPPLFSVGRKELRKQVVAALLGL